MSQPPEFPTSPDQLKAWIESLDQAEVLAIVESIGAAESDAVAAAGADKGIAAHPPVGFAAVDLPRNEVIALPDPPAQPVLLTVHVGLDGSDPLVWRRLTIPGDLDLARVHDALQCALGWTDSHLHRFHVGDQDFSSYFVTAFDISEGDPGTPEAEARLDQVLREPGDTLRYLYDFGDGWSHTVRLETVTAWTGQVMDPATAPPEAGGTAGPAAYPLVVLAGAGACPPEDAGGISGYAQLAAWVRSGHHPAQLPRLGLTADEVRAWLPAGWHPDGFDLQAANRELTRLAPRDTGPVLAGLPADLLRLIEELPGKPRLDVEDWLAAPCWRGPAGFSDEVAAALTAPIRVVLQVVGEGLRLTAAGYLPPRVVATIHRAIPMGDEWIGAGSREAGTWPVALLREQVRAIGLIRKANGRLLPTAAGRRLRDDPQRLLEHVLARLPFERDEFGRLAAGLLLLGVAGGLPLGGVRMDPAEVADDHVLTEAVGAVFPLYRWRTASGEELEPADLGAAASDTLGLVRQLVRCLPDRTAEAGVARQLAMAILRRMD